jgi:hypothetical protein
MVIMEINFGYGINDIDFVCAFDVGRNPIKVKRIIGYLSDFFSVYEDLKVFTDVIGLIQKDYVEETKSKDLVYGAIKGMLETLDPIRPSCRRTGTAPSPA